MKLNELTVTQAVQKLESGEISSYELTKACLERADQVEGDINGYTTLLHEAALDAAKAVDEKRAKGEKMGKLAGIPGAIKDGISTKGVESTASSLMLKGYIPPYNATVIQKLNGEDYVLLGKTNLDEFAMGSSTENSYMGVTKNPWDLTRVSGGSSGGSAAVVAADEAMFSLGSDTGGSIRQPAAYCGVVGLKPTYGSVSRYGLFAFASSLDQIGPITKSVEDAALIMNVISGRDHRDSTSAVMEYPDYQRDLQKDIKGMKVGVPKEYFEAGMCDDTKKVFQNALDTLAQLGAVVEETTLPTFDYSLSAYYIISSAEVASNLSRYDGIRYGYRAENVNGIKDLFKKTRSEGFGAEAKRRIALGNYVLSSGYYDAYYLKALKVRTLIKRDFEKLFETYDILFSPVTASPAFAIGEKTSPLDMYATDIFTVPVNIAGLCAISLPGGLSSEGLPIGVQVIGKAFSECTVLNAAYQLEQALGFACKPSL